MRSNSPKLAIFNTFKTKSHELTGEAIRQRTIIVALATRENPVERTRTSISQMLANEYGVIWKNLYSGVFRDLDEVFIPLGLVGEEGRLPLRRGPKALQEKGTPYYKLTHSGLIASLSLKEIKNKLPILENFLSSNQENELEVIVLKLAKIAPKFTLSLFERYVRAYCEGKLKNLLPFNLEKLKDVSDETLQVQKELLGAFSDFSKSDREKIINLF